MRLNSEELSEVLDRAQSIDRMQSAGHEYDEITAAAEEMGISREATLQALRERLGTPLEDPTEGEMVFAKSADGHFYAAKVLGEEKSGFRVRFLSGGEVIALTHDMKAFTLTPGLKVSYYSPSAGYWSSARVSRFDDESGKVKLDSWTESEKVSLENIRLPGASGKSSVVWGYLATLASGGLLGALLHWLMTR